MAKADVIAAGVAAIQAGEVQVYSDQLGLAYDGGFKDGVASVPPPDAGEQAKIDAAVQAQKDADAAALVQKQADFDALAAKEALEADQIAKIKAIFG